jgi:hypothetical protein
VSCYTIQHREPRTIVMGDAEIALLPIWAQEVIRHQRALEEFCSKALVPLREAQNLLDRRAFLARAAHKMWVNADMFPTR